jgi:hypothetical protein
MRKFSDNKRGVISTAFNLVFIIFLVISLSLLLWQLPSGTPPPVQTQTEAQDPPVSTVVVLEKPTVPVKETFQVTPSGLVTETYVLVAAAELGVVTDEKFSIILIEPDSAGEKAGLQLGDILERIAGIPVALEEDRINAKMVMGSNLDGTEMHLTIIRNGETFELPFIPIQPRSQPTQSPEQAAKQEPPPTITPVLPPYHFF